MSEKEVYYYKYCPQCEYFKQPEAADPCDECLAQPVNEDSHKPLYFKQAKTKKTQSFKKCPSQS